MNNSNWRERERERERERDDDDDEQGIEESKQPREEEETMAV
jgi:hypothetical protein